ncbi:hypothetical protein HanHA300_Chr00c0516g0776141 [Helianthus annuus]|nr:hypothetical protein HanHA300_Chr00c0516g0776141 [Helianthus annuus]
MVATTRGSSHGKQKIDDTPGVIYLSSKNEVRQTKKRRKETDARVLFDALDDTESPNRVMATRTSTNKHIEILNISDGCTRHEKKLEVVKRKEIPSLKTRSSPKKLYNAISYMSQRQEEAVKEMGFGGLLGFVVDEIFEKLAFHVVDQFDADRLTLNLGKAQLPMTSTLISKLLGIREGVRTLARVCHRRRLTRR